MEFDYVIAVKEAENGWVIHADDNTVVVDTAVGLKNWFKSKAEQIIEESA